MITAGPRRPRLADLGLARFLVLAGNALLLVWGLADGWRVTHLIWPFVLESIIVGLFALRHITRGTIRGTLYRIDGGAPTRARWPRIVRGVCALVLFVIGVVIIGLFAMFISLVQPIDLPQPGDPGNRLRLLGVIAIVAMLIHRHYLHYRQKLWLEAGVPMDLTRVVHGYRETLVAWVGFALVALAATYTALESVAGIIESIAGADWRHLGDSLLLVAAIAAKARYEWWLEDRIE